TTTNRPAGGRRTRDPTEPSHTRADTTEASTTPATGTVRRRVGRSGGRPSGGALIETSTHLKRPAMASRTGWTARGGRLSPEGRPSSPAAGSGPRAARIRYRRWVRPGPLVRSAWPRWRQVRVGRGARAGPATWKERPGAAPPWAGPRCGRSHRAGRPAQLGRPPGQVAPSVLRVPAGLGVRAAQATQAGLVVR